MLGSPFQKQGKEALHFIEISRTYKFLSKEFLKLQLKAISTKAFVNQNHFDTSLCFLIDMSLPANHNRFFIYDLIKIPFKLQGWWHMATAINIGCREESMEMKWAAVVHRLENTGLVVLIMEDLDWLLTFMD